MILSEAEDIIILFEHIRSVNVVREDDNIADDEYEGFKGVSSSEFDLLELDAEILLS